MTAVTTSALRPGAGVPTTVLTTARLTLLEARRRRVMWALAALTVLLLALDGWGFSKIPSLHTGFGDVTSGQARLIASQLLNLVMFALSLIVALGTAFLAGPTLSGELDSGVAHAMFARPVSRSAVIVGKWLGLSCFAAGYVALAGTAQLLIVRWTVGYVPPNPVGALVLIAAEAVVLLTLAMTLSSVLSPMASGVVAVGVFGAVWVAGVVGGVGAVLHNPGVARVGTISRVILPTDGLWNGAMNELQAPGVLDQFGVQAAGSPFLAVGAVTPAYLAWTVAWVALVLGLCLASFSRRDL